MSAPDTNPDASGVSGRDGEMTSPSDGPSSGTEPVADFGQFTPSATNRKTIETSGSASVEVAQNNAHPIVSGLDGEPFVAAFDVNNPTAPPKVPAPVNSVAGASAAPSATNAIHSVVADVAEAMAVAGPPTDQAPAAKTAQQSSAVTSGADGQTAVRGPVQDSVSEVVTLKNARVGIEYVEAINANGLQVVRIAEPMFDMGLGFDRATSTVIGTPAAAGDFEWVLTGVRNQVPVTITIRLAVIPDPKSLWKDLPSDSNAVFWKEDQYQEALDLGEVFVVAASKRGRSHAHDGRFRDDDCAVATSGPGGWHVVAVADGAGSAQFSRQGSKLAVDYIKRTLPGAMATIVSPRLDEILARHDSDPQGSAYFIRQVLYEALVDAAYSAAKEVESAAKQASHEPGDYSTTLIMTAVTKTSQGWFIASFSVGDGGAALLDLPAGTVTALTTPDGGEFAGQTRFLRKDEFSDGARSMNRIHFAIRPAFTALVLMTDGISDPKFPTEVDFADFNRWKDFWEGDLTPAVNVSRDNPHAGEEILAWMDFWSDGNHDDRTLAVLLP